jgi:hypothetical protein
MIRILFAFLLLVSFGCAPADIHLQEEAQPAPKPSAAVKPGNITLKLTQPTGAPYEAGMEGLVMNANKQIVARAVTDQTGQMVLTIPQEGNYVVAFGNTQMPLQVAATSTISSFEIIAAPLQLGMAATAAATGLGTLSWVTIATGTVGGVAGISAAAVAVGSGGGGGGGEIAPPSSPPLSP